MLLGPILRISCCFLAHKALLLCSQSRLLSKLLDGSELQAGLLSPWLIMNGEVWKVNFAVACLCHLEASYSIGPFLSFGLLKRFCREELFIYISLIQITFDGILFTGKSSFFMASSQQLVKGLEHNLKRFMFTSKVFFSWLFLHIFQIV